MSDQYQENLELAKHAARRLYRDLLDLETAMRGSGLAEARLARLLALERCL